MLIGRCFSMPSRIVFGDAGRMGKIVGASPALKTHVLSGGFQPDLVAFLNSVPQGLSSPTFVSKKFAR